MNQIFIRVASGVRYGFDEAANFAVVDVSGRKVGFIAQEQVFRAVMEAIDVAPDATAQSGSDRAWNERNEGGAEFMD